MISRVYVFTYLKWFGAAFQDFTMLLYSTCKTMYTKLAPTYNILVPRSAHNVATLREVI